MVELENNLIYTVCHRGLYISFQTRSLTKCLPFIKDSLITVTGFVMKVQTLPGFQTFRIVAEEHMLTK